MEFKYSVKNVDITNFLFLFLTPFVAIFLTWYWIYSDGFHWGQVVMGLVMYFLTGISITAGYHRLFSHRAYEANALVKLFYLIFGASTFQNSVLKWAGDHRLHHNQVDTESDPYSIKEGFFYAHMGWVFLKKNSEIKEKFAKDLLNDKFIMWQHKYYLLISVVTGLVLPSILGQLLFNSWLGGLAVAGFSRIVFVHHCTFLINSLCHYWGTNPYTDTNTAKDSWYMALFTFGEGYHNFHHFFQTDYRNGIRWFHFDPTKWFINVLKGLGLVSKLKVTAQDRILAAQMQMRVKNLESKIPENIQFQQEVEKLKAKVLTALENLQRIREQYKFNKAKELKAKLKIARKEFKETMKAWNAYMNNLSNYSIQTL